MAFARKASLGPQWPRRAIVLALLDFIGISAAYFVALLLRYDLRWSQVPGEYLSSYLMLMPGTLILAVGLMWVLRLYHSIWSFASFDELLRLVICWAVVAIAMPPIGLAVGIGMPASFWLVGDALAFGATTVVRYSYRFARVLRYRGTPPSGTERTLMVGAGECGRALMREIALNPQLGLSVVAVIDDNPSKQGRYLEAVPIVGGRDRIAATCEEYGVSRIVFAIPSCPVRERREILELCSATGCEVSAVPGMYQVMGGEVSVSSLREIRLEDLLGREPVVIDADEVRSLIEGRVVLVTGGGGSIGSELCRQVAREDPTRLVILDIYENGAYDVQQELARRHPGLDLVVLVGSVRDEARVREVFEAYRPDVVFHAAAHKHVPLMEVSPREAVKNNVFGTLNVARAALEHGTGRFVLISTDKAVNPTNVMGATKRICEMVVQAMNRRADGEGRTCDFVAVRFGNVLGSNGSVVPLFERQIAEGGPVTVTHRDITRYFMTIPEAVSLVLQCACWARGGEIFVLDMGEPVRIDDMARQLIHLAGYEPDVDIAIEYTGLRPGEKLYEERLMDEEGLRETENELISIARPIEMDDALFREQVLALGEACQGDDARIRELLAECVPTYRPEGAGE